jgi:hypothetical protein
MSIAAQRPMTIEVLLAWEAGQERRWEFDGFVPATVTAGTAGDSAIERNPQIAPGSRLRGNPCQVCTADLKIRVAGSIRYPDAFVVCSPVPLFELYEGIVFDPAAQRAGDPNG